ncbi:8-amino-7-oxononanoate synthase [Bordetella sp. N]|uniref:aminotransferase class I/II-fold pyridoxal phosphate-dependent enzyme n=1 Tax=Bordetella sp. N TaxID=1746199 RepID=UPI00070FC8C1|nr:8-amino-7-oxononanoate synthase [Bordetella sp. N]ALM86671.1 8-amino-7-oxononanoate synthase [Bordetella sp. N]
MEVLQAGLEDLQARDLIRRRRTADTPCAPRIRLDGRDVLAFASNDYLGLASHPALIDALAEGARRYGVGSGGSHLLGGHSRAHALLEDVLAEYCGGFARQARALTFSTGYMANLAVLTALAGRGATIYSDALNHASLIDGARLSRAEVRVYPHGDVAALGARLAADDAGDSAAARGGSGVGSGNGCRDSSSSSSGSGQGRGSGNGNAKVGGVKIIVTDAVFSMDGDTAPLAELLALAERHQAWLVVDDAHGFGVNGANGAGTIAASGLRSPLLVYMGTLGKAAGTAGAFVVAEDTVIEWLIQRARSYIFTTAAAPALAHATIKSVELMRGDEGVARRARLQGHIDTIRSQLSGVPGAWPRTEPASSTSLPGALSKTTPVSSTSLPPLPPSFSAIQPILVGENHAALALAEHLLAHGYWVPAVRPPTVPVGTARLRLSLSASHERAEIERLCELLLQA